MRAVIQRVTSASVTAGEYHATVGRGFLVLLGVAPSDELAEAHGLADKVVALRVFEDAAGKMNLALGDVGGEVLCISQFTLYGDVRRGNRPSFVAAAAPEIALPLYEAFCGAIEAAGVSCQRGVFGAHMEVSLVNDGPVTIIIDSDDLAWPRRT